MIGGLALLSAMLLVLGLILATLINLREANREYERAERQMRGASGDGA